MNVILISLFETTDRGRVGKLAQFTLKDENLTLITSDFDHGKKQYIDPGIELANMKVIRIHVPFYDRNVSFKRIKSHIEFARKLKKTLENLEVRPDLVYCAMPSSTAAYVAGKYCKKNKIPYVIDVIDLWPDSLIPIVKFKRVIDLCVRPWKWITHKAYRMADYISAESKKYAEVAHNINPMVPYSHTYLGIDGDKVKEFINSSPISLEKPDNEIWIGYGGSLGQSYDFKTILEGLKELNNSGIKYKMWFIGDGENRDYIQEYASKEGLNVEITGRLSYNDLLKHLSYCDIAVNSFKEGTLVVHSYKFNDYVATGCYILNNLPGETAEMVECYGIGTNFNRKTFSEVLLNSIENWDNLSAQLPNRINQIKEKELDSKTIYRKLGEDVKQKLRIGEG